MKHNFEISYTQQGDYLLPDLRLPEQPKVEIGIWGKRHLRYIEKYHKIRYTNLLTSCKLTAYLADIDEHTDLFFGDFFIDGGRVSAEETRQTVSRFGQQEVQRRKHAEHHAQKADHRKRDRLRLIRHQAAR